MKKDIEWLKGKLEAFQKGENMFTVDYNAGMQDAFEYVQELIDQLDEPQELPVIPQWVADNIEDKKRVDVLLSVAIAGFPEFKLQKELGINEHECNELYARAWLDGYMVEDAEEIKE